MGLLVFPVDDTLKSIIAHSRANPEGQSVYGEPVAPSLMLVKDQGAYLMAPTDPRQLTGEGEKCVVVYAKGCNPGVDDDFYETARSLCGGDDFCEGIALDEIPGLDTAFEIQIELTETSLAVSTLGPKLN
ncbi:DUF3085 domain-containing protein [Sphingomonas jaspsi]|uniref:DUF3085 domain-containing protein n=1 Tax=Sphingomonas jaspsi TaxID=392409 RepID=UPI0004BA0BB1|nr:DUF3085 domain-containing protein [Sphingomonas jaspsi]